MLTLTWIKSVNNSWLGLDFPNLSDITTTGVYVIWHGGQTPRTVRVGQGIIRDRLSAHKRDAAVLRYQPHGLWVTWAAVPAHQMDGVERYLANLLSPLVGDAFPNVTPLAVNSPFAA